MINDKKVTLRPIFESTEGIHVTAYLVNNANADDLKAQIQEVLAEAYEFLQPVLEADQRRKLLEPIESLVTDARLLQGLKGNIGLFRTKDSFRVLSLPVEVERQCHVASSFHVKPLLRWMQLDRDFLLLGLTAESAQLYLGSQTSIQLVDSVLLPTAITKKKGAASDEVFLWLNDWLHEMTKKSQPRLFLAGDEKLVPGLIKKLRYKNVCKTPISFSFNEENLSEICGLIRTIQRGEAKRTLERALYEFRVADDMNLTKKNIFQISRAVAQGKVKKLIVADTLNIFGKVDKKTGGLAIHPFDLDHEDDDILDDLAQAVLAAGGEVVVAPQEQMPQRRPAIAILDEPDSNLENFGSANLDETLEARLIARG